uniref:Uncharacterized protein n=1 Tax=Rhizophora mucronata TaxID=61149 RepID=A0A2P2K8H7_RHIMU
MAKTKGKTKSSIIISKEDHICVEKSQGFQFLVA